MISPQDTIAAIATPLGEGGLGVIRVSGNQAITIVSQIFQKHNPSSPAVTGGGSMDPRQRHSGMTSLQNLPSHTCHLGSIGSGVTIDHVVVTLFRAPNSYTGEDVVEISAHGSPFTLRKILDLCLAKGARLAGPGEFTERAFLNGKMDLTQAEAVAELIRAKTDKSQAAALSQLQGSLSGKIRALRDNLLPLLAHIEVGIDHSDEDHDFLPRAQLVDRCQDVQEEIEELLSSGHVSKILREGFRVAFLGRPNVGKSSLLNALLKEERAIVTPIPGTTRDTLEEGLNLQGIPVILTDTAGVRRTTRDPIEQLGIERTRKAREQADVVLAVFDGSEPFTSEDDDVMKACLAKPHVLVINKCDLPICWNKNDLSSDNRCPSPLEGEGGDGGNTVVLAPPPASSPSRGEEIISVSAKTGEGLNTLIETIAELALHEKAQAAEAQWLLNARHEAALLRAKDSLVQAVQSAREESFEECVALDLQTALAALGEVIGETTTEDLLDQIFSTFCVGK